MHAKPLQSCLTVCDAMDYCLLGPTVHGFSQTRILRCVVVTLSRGSSCPMDVTDISYISYIMKCQAG